MTCQHCKKNCKTSNQQSFVNRIKWILDSISEFLVCFTTFSERKVSLKEEKLQRFVAPDRSKIISLQDFSRVPVTVCSVFTVAIRQSLSFTLNFAYLSPAFSFSFSLPFSSFHVCRHIRRVHEFIAFFKMSVYFSKKQLAVQLPAEKNGLHRGADVRTVGRRWRHNQTKIFRIDALLNFLPMGLRAYLSCCGLTRRILTTVMTNIVVDKSADNAKPRSIF